MSFESVIGGEKVGRYSFIATGARGRLTAYGLELRTEIEGQVTVSKVADPLDSLWNAVTGKRVADLSELPPIIGGAFGYAAYDVVRYVEDLPNPPSDDRGLPDLDFCCSITWLSSITYQDALFDRARSRGRFWLASSGLRLRQPATRPTCCTFVCAPKVVRRCGGARRSMQSKDRSAEQLYAGRFRSGG